MITEIVNACNISALLTILQLSLSALAIDVVEPNVEIIDSAYGILLNNLCIFCWKTDTLADDRASLGISFVRANSAPSVACF